MVRRTSTPFAFTDHIAESLIALLVLTNRILGFLIVPYYSTLALYCTIGIVYWGGPEQWSSASYYLYVEDTRRNLIFAGPPLYTIHVHEHVHCEFGTGCMFYCTVPEPYGCRTVFVNQPFRSTQSWRVHKRKALMKSDPGDWKVSTVPISYAYMYY